jgi:hypothetical protein
VSSHPVLEKNVDPELIPALPEDLTTLSDDELQALHERLLDVEARIFSGDPDTVQDASNADVMESYETVIESIQTVKGEQARRDEETQAVTDRMSELRSGVREDEPAAEEEPAAEAEAPAEATEEEFVLEGEVVEEPALVASSRPFRARRVEREAEPEDDGMSLVAASDIPGFSSGLPITKHQLAEALIAKRQAFVAAPKGYREKVVVASARTNYPDDQFISDEDPLGLDKIKSVIGQAPGAARMSNSLVAAGGICAPTDVRYAWDVLGVTDTPVWDGLPKFGAARGGIRFPVIPTIADITTAITTVTAAQDAAGGSSAEKDCQAVTCPTFSEVLVDIVARCLEFPNLTARTYPEMVTGWGELLAVAFAQELEAKVLTTIKAGSIDVTDLVAGTSYPAALGAVGIVYPVLIQAAANLRAALRLSADAALRALIPAWVLDVLVADYHRRHSVDPTSKTREMFAAHFAQIGILPTFYLDGSSDGSQVPTTQAAGVLQEYPAFAEVFLYPEGTWLGLDAGQIDLGVVRDSTLNSTNKYQIFAEQFLNVAKVGGRSVQLRFPVGPTGVAAADSAVTVATSM